MSWAVYERLLNVYGTNEADRAVNEAKETFCREAIDNPGYHPDCKRNGIPQRFLIERTDVPYKAKFVTFPDEEIYPGDLIEVEDYIYIIIEPPRFLDKITWAAVGRLCNIDLKWQNFDGRICHSPVCLDAGVYSTTLNGTDTIQAPDKQFKLYMPYNDETAQFYLDKRIAVDTRYDKHGKKILECYRVTGMNRIAKTYGQDGHLLICELRSSTFSSEKDNVDEMICDYVTPPEESDAIPSVSCVIAGRSTIRIGKTQQYTTSFFDANGDELTDCVTIWDVSDCGLPITTSIGDTDNTLLVSVPKDENLIGTVFVVKACADGTEEITSIEIEVVS